MNTVLEKNSRELLERHHQNCLFKNILKDGEVLSFSFNKRGGLRGRFFCHPKYQGYDNRIHGGILAAVIDESMVHCLMGHDIVGVTISLSIKYRLPVFINNHIEIITRMSRVSLNGSLHGLETEIVQDRKTVVTASGEFFVGTQNVFFDSMYEHGNMAR